MFDRLIHKTFRVPYTLNVRHSRIKKNATTTYIFIHGIGDTGELWNNIIPQLPESANYVTVDLLGFGDSPYPSWATYDAKAQARSLLATYLKLGITSKVVVVGHSLGGLVAVEFAKRYKILTRRLILCSPPIYDRPTTGVPLSKQAALRWIYKNAAQRPEAIVKAFGLVKQLGVTNNSFDVHHNKIDTFIKSLQSSIINQTTIDDISKINIPVTILYGVLDPVIVQSTLRAIGRKNLKINVQSIVTSHFLDKIYQKQLLNVLVHADAKTQQPNPPIKHQKTKKAISSR